MHHGIFIVFEGIDGSGTSTQASLLHERLNRMGRTAATTTEPSSGPIGTLIRQGLHGRVRFASDTQRFDEQMAYLFAADRHDHLYNDVDGVLSLTSRGIDVVCTRYYFSSFAYHCHSEEDFRFVHHLNQRFPEPDLMVYLRNSVETSMDRLKKRAHTDAYENAEKLLTAAANYERMIAQYKGRLIVRSATAPIADLHESIYEAVQQVIGANTQSETR